MAVKHDALGRLTSVTDALNQVTRYIYNEQGRMTEQIDANGHTTRFAYDLMGRLVEKTLPLGQRETYEPGTGRRSRGRTGRSFTLTTCSAGSRQSRISGGT